MIAKHLIEFFQDEVTAGRLPKTLLPLQVGFGGFFSCGGVGLVGRGFGDGEVGDGGRGRGCWDGGCHLELSKKRFGKEGPTRGLGGGNRERV